MKNNPVPTSRLFQDRPLPETPHPTRRYSTLYATGLDRTDYVDSMLRLFLALCMLVSLVICGQEWGAPPSKTVVQQTPAPTPMVADCCPTTKPTAL